MWGELLLFAGIMALGQFSPGPDMILVTRTALARGRVAGWWTVLGISTGLCLHAGVAVGGMAYLISRGGGLATGLRWAAAAYLTWLGYRLLREAFIDPWVDPSEDERVSSRTQSDYLRGFLCNVLNPKVALFFAGVAAPFLDGDRPGWWPAVLWGILAGEGLILWSLWVWILQFPPFRDGYRKAAKWIDAAFGLGLLVLAVVLVIG